MAYQLYNYGNKNIQLPNSNLYLNARTSEGRKVLFPIGDNIQNGNTLIVGTTRTGKTKFISNMAGVLRENYKNELFVFMDVKQDYISDLRLYKDGDYIVSQHFIIGKNNFQWSIIKEAWQSGQPESEIKEIIETLFESIPNQGENQLFVESAKLAFCAYLYVYIEKLKEKCRQGKVITLNDIPSNDDIISLYNKMGVSELRDWICLIEGQKELCNNVLPIMSNGMPTKYAESVLSIVRIFVEMFNGNFCGKNKHSIHDFMLLSGKAIFLEFDYNKQRMSAAFFRIILKKLIQKKMALNSPYKNKKLYLILDESVVLNGEFDLVNALNVGAGDGLRTVVACQSIDHLYMQAPTKFNEHYGNAMLAGFANVICFRPSDGNTINAIQEKFGKADIERMVISVNRYQPATVTVSNDYIVNSEQLNNLGLGDAYIKLKNEKPVRIHFEER